ncbi:MAG: hypothetical protein AAGK32_16545, partial [Actinomycetota bacterium]
FHPPLNRGIMSLSESDRRALHAAAHQSMGKEADLLMDALFSDPERMATSDDVTLLGAELRTEMAELRTELRTEMVTLGADLRTEFHEATTGQTRTLLFGLVGTVMAMSTVQLVSLLVVA